MFRQMTEFQEEIKQPLLKKHFVVKWHTFSLRYVFYNILQKQINDKF